MCKFSVIIPVYNMEKYLSECVESVLSQNFKDFEIILVDDGSTDSSKEICDQYSDKYSFVYTIHQKNQGLSEARNTGIRMAKGNYLLFLDSDDFIKKNGLEILNKIVNENDPDIIINNYYYFDEESNDTHYNMWNVPNEWKCSGEVLMACTPKNHIVLMGCCVVIKHKYLMKIKLDFYPGIKHEDELWIDQAIIQSEKIVFNQEPYYYYRIGRPGSITKEADPKKLFDKLFIIDELIKFAQSQMGINQIAIEQRCAKILTGTIQELDKYRGTRDYASVSKEIRKRLDILKLGGEPRYTILYVLCFIFGDKMISKLWNR